MVVKGRARVDRRTKKLIQRLQPYEIAIISHNGIDKLAAQGLIEARCKLVLNADLSLSPDYPNEGPLMLIKAGIPIIDNLGPEIMSIPEGSEVEVIGDTVYVNETFVARGEQLDEKKVRAAMEVAKSRLGEVLTSFVDNTLSYARNEIGLVAQKVPVPPIQTELEFGYRPDIVIGDMDSVSDAALREAKEIIVHAYTNGEAPGLKRIKEMGLSAVTLPLSGTSEDAAMLLAYEKGASLIVAVGTHSNVLDFLEKGRRGMGSTFLVRLKVGSILVDAKGVSRLYRSRVKGRYLAQVIAAALLPFAAVAVISPPIRQLMRLVIIQFRVLLGL